MDKKKIILLDNIAPQFHLRKCIQREVPYLLSMPESLSYKETLVRATQRTIAAAAAAAAPRNIYVTATVHENIIVVVICFSPCMVREPRRCM